MSFDREELGRLRAAYVHREPEAPSHDVVPAERIWAAAAGELSPAETEDLALRAASDPELASLWAMALERGAADREDDSPLVARALRGEQSASPWFRWRLAGAALLVGLAAAALVLYRPAPDDVWRGDASEAITLTSVQSSPAGLRLDWEAAPGATWSLRVFDADLDPVYRADELSESEALVPPDALPEGALTWQVTGVWPDQSTARSPVFPL